jgi:hypothetical protein
MKYVVLAEVILFLIFAVPAIVLWLRQSDPMDALDGSVSILFSAALAIIIALTVSGWWVWSAFA